MTEEEKLQAEMDGLGPAKSSMAKLSDDPSSKMTTEHPGATPPLGDSKKSLHDKDSKQSKSQLSQKSKEGRGEKEGRGGARPSRVSKAFKR